MALLMVFFVLVNGAIAGGVDGKPYSDCGACHTDMLGQFEVDPVQPTSCTACHQNLLTGVCDSGTFGTPYGLFKTPMPVIDAVTEHTKHAGTNERAGQPECARCHAQADCRTCHVGVPHGSHSGGFFPESWPRSLTVADGIGLATVSVTCAAASCHATVQNTPGTGGQVRAIEEQSRVSSVIPVGASPRGLALNSMTRKLYVANRGDDTVSVIDADPVSSGFNTVVGTIPVGAGPYDVAVDELSNKIYVTDPAAGAVHVIDGWSNAVVATVVTGGQPRDIEAAPSVGSLFIADLANDEIIALDMVGGQITGRMGLPTGSIRPQGLAANTVTGRLYVGCSDASQIGASKIAVFDMGMGAFVQTLSAPGIVHDLAVDQGRNLILTAGLGQISILNGDTGEVVRTIPLGFEPMSRTAVAYNSGLNRILALLTGGSGQTTLYVFDGTTYTMMFSEPAGMYSKAISSSPASPHTYIAGGSATLVPDSKPSCLICHTNTQVADHGSLHEPNPYVTGSECASCHVDNLSDEHAGKGYDCGACHSGTGPAIGATAFQVIQTYKSLPAPMYVDKTGCQDCHVTVTGTKGDPASLKNQGHVDLHTSVPSVGGTACQGCHNDNLVHEHVNRSDPASGQPYGCLTCHGQGARQEVKDAIGRYAVNSVKVGCSDCHAGVTSDLSSYTGHVALHDTTEVTTSCFGDGNGGCHASANTYSEHQARGYACITCHPAYTGTKLDPAKVAGAVSSHNPDCSGCHTVHGDINVIHTASNVGTMYRDYECTKCHSTSIIPEHDSKVSSSTFGDGCLTCHSYPRGSFDIWGESCSQGDCHAATTGPGSVHTEDSLKHVSGSTACAECHSPDASVVHAGTIALNGTTSCGISNGSLGCHVSPDSVPGTAVCADCHADKTTTNHGYTAVKHTASSSPTGCFSSSCHNSEIKTEHDKYLTRLGMTKSCEICHTVLPGRDQTWTKQVKPWNKTCDACHGESPHHLREPYDACGECHEHPAGEIHSISDHRSAQCGTCHGPTAPGCVSCHEHSIGDIHGEHGGEVDCTTCHTSGVKSPGPVRAPFAACNSCHAGEVHGESEHTEASCLTCHGENAPGCVSCHEHSNSEIHGEHSGGVSCVTCHTAGVPETTGPLTGIIRVDQALWFTSLYSSASSEAYKPSTDITLAMSDGITGVGYKVSRYDGSTKVVSIKVNKDARLFSKVLLNAYVVPGATARAKVYAYAFNGSSVYEYKEFPISGSGWQQWDVTSLASRMAGYGWMKFRITAASSTLNVSEAYLSTVVATSYTTHHH